MGKRNKELSYEMGGKVLKVRGRKRLGSDYAKECKAVKTNAYAALLRVSHGIMGKKFSSLTLHKVFF